MQALYTYGVQLPWWIKDSRGRQLIFMADTLTNIRSTSVPLPSFKNPISDYAFPPTKASESFYRPYHTVNGAVAANIHHHYTLRHRNPIQLGPSQHPPPPRSVPSRGTALLIRTTPPTISQSVIYGPVASTLS